MNYIIILVLSLFITGCAITFGGRFYTCDSPTCIYNTTGEIEVKKQ